MLDMYYSRYIRLRDSYDGINGSCVSCGRVLPIKDMDNGHFISRSRKATKYDERNTHLQCKRCNGYLKGNIADYAVFLEGKYGFGILQELKLKSNNLVKNNAEWFKNRIEYYKNLVTQMDKYRIW